MPAPTRPQAHRTAPLAATAVVIAILALAALTPATPGLAAAAGPSVGASSAAAGDASASVPATGSPRDVEGAIVAVTVGAERTGSGVAVSPTRVLTSMNVLQGQGPASILVQGQLLPFTIEATDSATRLAVLRTGAEMAVPTVRWGDSGVLMAGDRVYALGLPSAERRILLYEGTVKSPALATGGDLLLTDIPVDPLVEGGALTTADGRFVGVIVARGLGAEEGELGWAVTSNAVKQVLARQAAGRERDARRRRGDTRAHWISRGILLAIIVVLVLFGRWFSRWYRLMEERELAKEAEAEARIDAVLAERSKDDED